MGKVKILPVVVVALFSQYAHASDTANSNSRELYIALEMVMCMNVVEEGFGQFALHGSLTSMARNVAITNDDCFPEVLPRPRPQRPPSV